MSIDRKLLWKAWPDGYLAMRGVQTVERWQCRWSTMGGHLGEFTRAEGNCVPGETGPGPIRRIITNNGKAARDDQGELANGDLLPNVDPSDTATWACLLVDLAAALSWTVPAWGWEHWPNDEVWVLHGPNDKTHAFTLRDTNNPALAMVLARAQLQEKSP